MSNNWRTRFAWAATAIALMIPGKFEHADDSIGAKDDGPRYSLSADAAAGMILAAEGIGTALEDSAAVFEISGNFLHRLEAPGWGTVLSHSVACSASTASIQSSSEAEPSLTVYEAYARLDAGDWGQIFFGKRRMGLGIGTTFSPGDIIDPRAGFWDQKDGFRGLCATASIGSEFSLRGAASLERAFAADKADPSLVTWAAQAEALLGALQLAAACAYSPDYAVRPSLGLSIGLGDLILQAEGAVELESGPYWFGTAGAKESGSFGDANLLVSIDYGYNGEQGLLKKTHYLLPNAKFGIRDAFDIYARSLIGLEGPSALLSTGLTLYPVQGFDIELTGTFALGAVGSELAALPATRSSTNATLRDAVGLATRVHF
jgi:hypothetical protein